MLARLRDVLVAKGVVLRLVALQGGNISTGRTSEAVERTLLTTRSIDYDALLVPAGAGARPTYVST